MSEITQQYAGPPGDAEDAYWMARALATAQRGIGTTSPNPCVGAVIVKDSVRMGAGHTAPPGGPHAEVRALAAASRDHEVRGATLYVTLEPCSTHGRTPPCCQAIIDHGIARVVVGSVDPNPAHAGRGVTILQEAGIEVVSGVRQAEADHLIRIFRHWIEYQRPYIIAKAGISVDGCLTRPPGESNWLTSASSRRDAQHLRILVDAILVGAETIRQDDPSLTVRHPWTPGIKPPLKRMILTRSGTLPKDARVFTDALAAHTTIIENASWPEWLESATCAGISSILIEGGGKTLTEALRARAVDELHLYVAPRLSGTSERFLVEALGIDVQLENPQVTRLGDDVRIVGRLQYAPS